MESTATSLLSEFWIVAWLFIMIVLWAMYYIPRAIKAHFETIDKMRDDFTDSLKNITEIHRDVVDSIANKFAIQVESLWKDHEYQNKILSEIHDKIHDKIHK